VKKTFTIKGQLPNLNEYTRACRTNRYAGAKMKVDAEEIISAHILEQLKGVHFEGTVKLSFKWYEPNRKRDLDNVCFAKKFILDALVSNGTIVADGWKGVVGFTDKFFVDANNPRIEVDIEEAGETDE
jgi:Holliday junction resolvase RusA-like endonuclease